MKLIKKSSKKKILIQWRKKALFFRKNYQIIKKNKAAKMKISNV